MAESIFLAPYPAASTPVTSRSRAATTPGEQSSPWGPATTLGGSSPSYTLPTLQQASSQIPLNPEARNQPVQQPDQPVQQPDQPADQDVSTLRYIWNKLLEKLLPQNGTKRWVWGILITFGLVSLLTIWLVLDYAIRHKSATTAKVATWFGLFFKLGLSMLTTHIFVVLVAGVTELLVSIFELTTFSALIARTTVVPQCAVILAIFRGLPFHHDRLSAAAARTAVTSEIAGSLWVILLLQVGFAYIVAAFSGKTHAETTPDDRAHTKAQETNTAICLVIGILFFVVSTTVNQNRGIAFAIGTSILWLAFVADLGSLFYASLRRHTEAGQVRRPAAETGVPARVVTSAQKFGIIFLMLVPLAAMGVANFYSSTWTIGAIEIVTETDHRIHAAFLELFLLPLASGAAEFRLVYRHASEGELTHLFDELMQVLKLRLVYSFLFAQMASLGYGQKYTPGFTATTAALFFAIMVVAVILIWKRVPPSFQFGLLFWILFLLILINTWTGGEVEDAAGPHNSTALFTPYHRR